MKKILVASNNAHKVEEIEKILADFGVEVLSLKDAGIDIEVEENGTTFMENSLKKASEVYDACTGKYMVLADDSGLMVDCLGGAPGVYSARFAGEHGNTEKNNEKLLKMLQGKRVEDRKAKFVCAMVLVANQKRIIKVQGEIEGYIVENEKGTNGFGYDPLFYVPEYNATFAEMGSEIKNKISHRAKALEELKNEIMSLLQED